MSTSRTVTLTYPAPPAAVAAMLADPDYQRQRLSRVGLGSLVPQVDQRAGGFVVSAQGTVPLERIPAKARRFVRQAVGFTLAESWGQAGDDGARHGSIKLTIKGAPVSGGATTSIAPAPDGPSRTVLTAQVDLTVSVPLVGRSIEAKAIEMVDRLVADEEQRATAWLAEHAG